jgi:hypothetical protein
MSAALYDSKMSSSLSSPDTAGAGVVVAEESVVVVFFESDLTRFDCFDVTAIASVDAELASVEATAERFRFPDLALATDAPSYASAITNDDDDDDDDGD